MKSMLRDEILVGQRRHKADSHRSSYRFILNPSHWEWVIWLKRREMIIKQRHSNERALLPFFCFAVRNRRLCRVPDVETKSGCRRQRTSGSLSDGIQKVKIICVTDRNGGKTLVFILSLVLACWGKTEAKAAAKSSSWWDVFWSIEGQNTIILMLHKGKKKNVFQNRSAASVWVDKVADWLQWVNSFLLLRFVTPGLLCGRKNE